MCIVILILQVSAELQSSVEALRGSCQLMSGLLPIARHGALLYSTLCQIGRLSPQKLLSWRHFLASYSTALAQYASHHHDVSKAVGSGGATIVCKEVTQQLNIMILQDTFRLE